MVVESGFQLSCDHNYNYKAVTGRLLNKHSSGEITRLKSLIQKFNVTPFGNYLLITCHCHANIPKHWIERGSNFVYILKTNTFTLRSIREPFVEEN